MNRIQFLIGVAGVIGFTLASHAQVPFFFPGSSAFSPEVSVVSTGVVNDVQATVSADRKYVTLNMRQQNSALLALRSFNFQQGGVNFGNVGDPPPAARPPGGKAYGKDDPASAVRTSPGDILAHAKSELSVLHRPGMTKVD